MKLTMRGVMDFLHGRDEGVWNFFQALHRPLRDQIMLGISAAGHPSVLLVLLIIAASVLMLRKKFPAAVFLAVAYGGALVLALATQATVGRLRPQIIVVPDGMNFLHQPLTAGSYPSLWTTLATATYLSMAYVGGCCWPARKLLLFRLALFLVLAIGVSRLYIGTCFPTDVLGGWLGGVAWLLVCRRVYERCTPTTAPLIQVSLPEHATPVEP